MCSVQQTNSERQIHVQHLSCAFLSFLQITLHRCFTVSSSFFSWVPNNLKSGCQDCLPHCFWLWPASSGSVPRFCERFRKLLHERASAETPPLWDFQYPNSRWIVCQSVNNIEETECKETVLGMTVSASIVFSSTGPYTWSFWSFKCANWSSTIIETKP